jgi:PAS domain S-box-containing protein
MVHTTPVRDEHGQIAAVMEMHTDISEIERLHELLHRSRARLVQLFEQVPCHATVQGPDLVIEHANRKFRDTFGEAVGEHCYRDYKHRDEPCLVCPARQTLEDGAQRHHEEVVVSAAGESINVLCTSAPIFDESGRPEAFIEMSTDITQIRRLQSQLTSIGLLVGSISHGIKGLLTGLDGGIYLVSSGFEKDDRARVTKGWQMAQRNVERIRSMVLDILYYAKDRDLAPAEADVVKLGEELGEEAWRDLPVIVITGHDQVVQDQGQSYLRSRGGVRGADGVLGKLVDPEALLALLARFCPRT